MDLLALRTWRTSRRKRAVHRVHNRVPSWRLHAICPGTASLWRRASLLGAPSFRQFTKPQRWMQRFSVFCPSSGPGDTVKVDWLSVLCQTSFSAAYLLRCLRTALSSSSFFTVKACRLDVRASETPTSWKAIYLGSTVDDTGLARIQTQKQNRWNLPRVNGAWHHGGVPGSGRLAIGK